MKSLNRIKLISTPAERKCLKNSYKLLKLLVKNKNDLTVTKTLSNRFGICTNTELSRLPTLYVQSIFKSWEEFSGDPEYPVKSGSENVTSGSYYRSRDDKYSGTYGEARIRLAEYVIKKMKKDLKNLKASA